jgi:Protein of unknown function DUF262/Protein of unknown function (DUF1524)
LQPTKLSIAGLFDQREQYLIPLFQRGYVWTLKRQIEPLWQDIIDRVEALAEHRADGQKIGAGKLKPMRKHFMGAIVVGPAVGHDSQAVPSREVIDGQQRTTTLQIMLLALRNIIVLLNDEALDDDVKTLTYNKGSYRTKSDHLKVWPTNVGRDVMQALAVATDLAAVEERFPAKSPDGVALERPLMVQAYLYFHGVLSCYLRGKRFDDTINANDNSEDATTISQALVKAIEKSKPISIPFENLPMEADRARLLIDALQTSFQIMRLQLEEDDDPQIVFETLNARGEPLTPSDLIRNYVFLRAARNGEPVDELYDTHWRRFDEQIDQSTAKGADKFWRRAERQGRLKSNRLDLFFYHYMGLRKRDEVKVAHVFQEFKDWWEEGEPRESSLELGRLNKLAKHFETLLAPDQKSRFGLFCRRLRLLDTATPIPLVLYLLEHHQTDGPDLLQAIGDIESYLVRRFICGLTTKSYNRIFIKRLLAEMAEERKSDAATLRAKLLALEGPSQNWPRDQEFETAWLHRRLYEGSNTRRVRAVLEGLETGLRNSKQEFLPDLEPLSVEHVLPQSWDDSTYPLSADTPEVRATRLRLLHSIGNLTLVTPGFNSALSNEAFAIKRPEITANSSLMLNAYFQKHPDDGIWGEEAIVDRAGYLFKTANAVWALPA